MIRLLKIELHKITSFKTFWILGLLYLLVLGTIVFGMQGYINYIHDMTKQQSPIPIPELMVYKFPDIWHNFTFLSGFLKIFLGVILLIIIGNEFSYKTIRQNIITGMSRKEWFGSKVLLVLTLSLASTLILSIFILILGFINSPELSFSAVTSELHYVAYYFYEVTCFLMFVLMLGMLVKKTGLAMGILLLYKYIIEPIVVYNLNESWKGLMPLRAIGNTIRMPNTQIMRMLKIEFQEYVSWQDMLITIGWLGIFVLVIGLLLKYRDL